MIGEASTGLSAVSQLSELDDCVVLVDIGLPDIDGIEVAQRIKANRPSCRILMLTASDDQNDIFDALEAGAEGYILKANGANNLEHAKNLEAAIRRYVSLFPKPVVRPEWSPSVRREKSSLALLNTGP